MAQLGSPDMRVPLMYAMAGEKRWPLAAERLDLLRIGTLCFEPPDLERFVCLRLAREAGEAGGSAPIVLNAANEVAVAALLDGRLRYVDIASVIASTLAAVCGQRHRGARHRCRGAPRGRRHDYAACTKRNLNHTSCVVSR